MTDSMDLGGSGNSFPFDTIGDEVTGRIIDFAERQQNDMDTGEPDVWPDGKPKMMIWVELQTPLCTEEGDDGKRSVYLRGSKKSESCSSLSAVAVAVKAATGGSAITLGSTLTLKYIGDGVASKKGWNPPKRYSARYVPKSIGVGLGTDTVVAQPAPAPVVTAVHPAQVATAGALTPEQIEALKAAHDPIAAHPQGAQLRAAGVPDDAIAAALGLVIK
jgi:hypothetical protein